MGVGVRPDPDKPPTGREKYARKFDVVDIAPNELEFRRC
jgi:hypothetical protein